MSGAKIKLLREIKTEGDDADKLAPQQKVIYDVLAGYGVGKEIDRDEVVKQVEAGGKLTTKQDPARVVSYYMQAFAKAGIAEMIKAPPAEKPAKEPKAAKGDKAEAKGKSPADAEKKPEKKDAGASAAD